MTRKEFYSSEEETTYRYRRRMSLPGSSIDSSSDTASCSESSFSIARRTPVIQDSIVLRILQYVKDPSDLKACSLVNRAWMRIEGSLKRNIKVLDWEFVESGRMAQRFPNLTRVDLTPAWTGYDKRYGGRRHGVTMTRKFVSMSLEPLPVSPFSPERAIAEQRPSPQSFDRGLSKLVSGSGGLVSLSLVDVVRDCGIDSDFKGAQRGIKIVAEGLTSLQQLDVKQCTDDTLFAVSECRNLQIVRLTGGSAGFSDATFTDSGLQHFAMNCRRIFSLSLAGCDVGFNGLTAVAKYCPMLTQLTLGGRSLQPGWMKALQFCSSLQELTLDGFKGLDKDPYFAGKLGRCGGLIRLEIKNCDIRPSVGFNAILEVCQGVKELIIRNCWGLEDEYFLKVNICKSLSYLVVDGCSLITTSALESILLKCRDLERLQVTFCSKVKEEEMSNQLSDKIFGLKELKWQPEMQKFYLDNLKEAGVGEKGRWLLGGASLLTSIET